MIAKSIFLTGGSGFVGSAVLEALLRRGHRVNALVRDRAIEREGVTSFKGDLFDDAALDAGLAGCDAVIHLVGIIREDASRGQTFERIHRDGAIRVMQRAQAAGVRRFVLMSALGANAQSKSDYARTKFAAETFLRSTDLEWTIFRPSVIHGPRGEFMRMLADWSFGRSLPYVYMPYFGTGLVGHTAKKLQPVFVDDVARAFVESLERPETIGQIIPLVGATVLDWPQMYDVVSGELLGKPKLAVGHPIWYMKMLTYLAPAKWLPFNRSQVIMAGEDNVADVAETERLLGFRPAGFDENFRQYAQQLK
ncbi:MAG: NAD(P)H-binding protein [Tepidisphaeraceae bacterium]